MKNLSQNLSQRIVAYLMLFAFFALPLSAQNHIRVTGVVVDENDEPLPGANVVVVYRKMQCSPSALLDTKTKLQKYPISQCVSK